LVSDSTAGKARLADALRDVDAAHFGEDDQPRLRKRRVKVRRKQEKFSHGQRIAIMIGAPTVLWSAIYLFARAVM
jgi:hypothetical protein